MDFILKRGDSWAVHRGSCTRMRCWRNRNLLSLGLVVSKPDMISHLENGKRPWAVVREIPGAYYGDLETKSATKDAILSENIFGKDLSQKIIVKSLTENGLLG